jgi:hypothetical protein
MRKEFPLKRISAVIANVYARLQTISGTGSLPLPPSAREQDPDDEPEQDEAKTQLLARREVVLQLDDLPIINTVTRRWPLAKLDYLSIPPTGDVSNIPPRLQPAPPQLARPIGEVLPTEGENYSVASIAEDETEEMDALPGDIAEA